MEKEELKVWRWLDRYVDDRVQYDGPGPRSRWSKCKSLISARIAELTKDERVAVTLTRRKWDVLCTRLSEAKQHCLHHRRYHLASQLNCGIIRISEQLKAKAP